jgi:tripartite-type tricarboxylate transporter receptor subunit TctC
MRRLCALIAFSLVFATPGLAQEFPVRPVQIIVPSSPGGISDTAARMIGEGLSKMWGQSVVVENRPGGGGSIGTGIARRAKADGYTLLVTTNGEFALNPVIYPNLPYDPNKDFLPLVLATYNKIAVVANAGAPYKTFEEFVAAAKQNPGSISWASAGAGTWNHLAGELLASELGVKLIHVPYKGGGPASTAVAGGDVPIGLLSISSVLPHIKSGKVRVLAVTAKDRSTYDKSWPTVIEKGYANVDATNWVAFFAPNGVPKAVSDKIEGDVRKVLAQPEFTERLVSMAIEPSGASSKELTEIIRADRARAERVAKEANIRVE